MTEVKKMRLILIIAIIVLLSINVQATIVHEATGTMTLSNVNGEITSNVNNPNNLFVSFRESYSSSGGGGGGAIGTVEQNPTVTHSYVDGLEANRTYTSSLYSDKIFIVNISFEINRPRDYEVELRVSQILDIDREPVPEMSSNKVVINYGAIFYSGLLYSDFNWGEIVFKIPKEVLEMNGASPYDVRFYRYYNGNWNELDTRVIDETDTRYFFRAYTPGFSYFAAAVPNKIIPKEETQNSKTNNQVTGQVTNNKIKEETNNEPSTKIKDESNSTNKKKNNVLPIIIVLIIGGILGAYIYISKQRDTKGLYTEEQGIILQDIDEKPKQVPFGTAKIDESLLKSPEEQLHDYVEQELREGFSREQIYQELLKAGWEKVVIAKVIDEFKDSFLKNKNVHKPSEDFDNLKGFIERKLAKGYSKETIKKNLLKVGWQEPIINSVIYEVNNPVKKASYSSEAETKLHDFIRKSLHRGHSKEEIFEKLISVGWEKNMVKKVMKKYNS